MSVRIKRTFIRPTPVQKMIFLSVSIPATTTTNLSFEKSSEP